MNHDLTPATRAVLRAAGRAGGLTGRKLTAPANIAQLVRDGAVVDAAGHLVECAATTRARKLRGARLQLARAQARRRQEESAS